MDTTKDLDGLEDRVRQKVKRGDYLLVGRNSRVFQRYGMSSSRRVEPVPRVEAQMFWYLLEELEFTLADHVRVIVCDPDAHTEYDGFATEVVTRRPRPNYDTAQKRWIDPHTVEWADTPLDENAVLAYEENPNKFSDDGDPFVVVNENGIAQGWNGKHRATAAMRQGRQLKVRYWDGRNATTS